METKKIILITTGVIFAGALIGGSIWWYNSTKNKDNSDKSSGGDGGSSDDSTTTNPTGKPPIIVTTNPTANDSGNKNIITPSTGKPAQSALNVYANTKGVDIKVATQGSTADNPVVLGSTVRKTESKGEKLGNFIKYLTIFAVPFVLFTDSYSGRKVLIAKSSVTVK